MAEKETRVVTVQVEYTCDTCGVGSMLAQGYTATSNPPQYAHKCNRCDATDTFLCVYPRLEHRKVGKQQPEHSPLSQVGNIDVI